MLTPQEVAQILKESLQEFGVSAVTDNILQVYPNYFLFKSDHLSGGEYKPPVGQAPAFVVIYKFPEDYDQSSFVDQLYGTLMKEGLAGVIPELLTEKVKKYFADFGEVCDENCNYFAEEYKGKYQDTIKTLLEERLNEAESRRGEDGVSHTMQHEFLHAVDFLRSNAGPTERKPITSELLHRNGSLSNKIRVFAKDEEWENIKDYIMDFCKMPKSYALYPDESFMSEVMTHLNERFAAGERDGINQGVKHVDRNALKALIIIQESIQHFSEKIQEIGLGSINEPNLLVNQGISNFIERRGLSDSINILKEQLKVTPLPSSKSLTKPSEKSKQEENLVPSLEQKLTPHVHVSSLSADSLEKLSAQSKNPGCTVQVRGQYC